MKKYLKMIPVALLPYIGFVLLAIAVKFPDTYYKRGFKEYGGMDIITLVIFLWSIVVFIILMQNIYVTIKGKYTSKEVAKVNLFIKCSHIPLYLFQLIWVLVFREEPILSHIILMTAIGFDAFFVTQISSINAIGCTVRLKRDGVLSKTGAILLGICSCIWLVDIIVAVKYVVMTKKDKDNNIDSETNSNLIEDAKVNEFDNTN